ncbi:hypothetical protein NIES970_18380 [[Synechococcus] sp. NIES-970]|nr:hypothetical protein NIES970_18380 [[Synechococcus] sp. NIES-970]
MINQLRLVPTTKGFTLIELLTGMLIVGILASISAPSFLGLVNRGRVNEALDRTRGALQEAQREALKKSSNCDLAFSPSGETINITGGCLVTGPRTMSQVTYRHTLANNDPNNVIQLDFKGVPTDDNFNDGQEVFVFRGNGNYERCLVISRALGLIRVGTYESSGPSDTSTDEAKCITGQV